MGDYVFETRVWIGRPREEVFALLAAPTRALVLLPPPLHARLLSPPPVMAAGAVLDYRLVWRGMPIRWRAFVREWDPPYRFVDVQVRGPFARWEHRHRFLESAGGTCVEDRITYRLPLGPLGRLLHAVAVGRDLRAAWAYRRGRLETLLGPVRAAPA